MVALGVEGGTALHWPSEEFHPQRWGWGVVLATFDDKNRTRCCSNANDLVGGKTAGQACMGPLQVEKGIN